MDAPSEEDYIFCSTITALGHDSTTGITFPEPYVREGVCPTFRFFVKGWAEDDLCGVLAVLHKCLDFFIG
jgi:hypothetical protein